MRIRVPHHLIFSLEHNPHKAFYMTIQQHIEPIEAVDWVSEESKERALETQDFWSIRWYPDTPVGFYEVYAHTLPEILRYIDENGLGVDTLLLSE